MKIINDNKTTFGIKFTNNGAFKDVVSYAAKNRKLMELDSALNILNNSNTGDILIVHGKSPNGIFSSFTLFKDRYNKDWRSSVQNMTNGAQSPEESSYNAIIELSTLGNKFKKLVGNKIEENITENSIFKKYTID